MLSSLHPWSHSILPSVPCRHYSHFKNERTQAQRKKSLTQGYISSLWQSQVWNQSPHTLIFSAFLIYRGKIKLECRTCSLPCLPAQLQRSLPCPRNTELFLFPDTARPLLNFSALAHVVSPPAAPSPPHKVFTERGGPPVRQRDILSRATNYLMLFNCPFPVPPSHFIFFLTSRGCWQRCLAPSTHPLRPPIRSQLEARRGALAPNLTFDNITAILTVCHGACQGHLKDRDCLPWETESTPGT